MYGESIDRPRHNAAQRSRTDDQGVVSVDEQGDGLESLGLRPTELKVPPRRPWWLAGPSFRFTVFQLCIWGGLFGLRIFQAFYDRGLDPLGWLLLICYGVGVALCFSLDRALLENSRQHQASPTNNGGAASNPGVR